ncbi:tetratricopeptide repeat protein [Streptomyces afghaniensis]|uniref:tetratricopeptide repeat protein n=1 Tax=Streptomyces afghaniensis TaxID=66865 RepID=UPI002468DE17|nr:tetratricopeptide repeat protein [Streptomyces afghaniensis]
MRGQDHTDTLTTRSNLAYCGGRAGDAAGAAAAFEQLLAYQERVLGPDHPDTFTTRSNIARWRGRRGMRLGADRCDSKNSSWNLVAGAGAGPH